MTEEKRKEEEAPISCSICLKEIGHAGGETFEVDDYVHHFCGLDCYTEWQRKKDEEEAKGERD